MQTPSRTTDVIAAFVIGAAIVATAVLRGDPLYVGIPYYVLAWLVLVGVAQIARVPPLFTAGASAALGASVLLYWAWQASLPRPEGMLGLGHVFALPGLAVGLIAAWFALRRRGPRPVAAFAVAFLACCIGFGIAQLVLCRTGMYCGRLSGAIG